MPCQLRDQRTIVPASSSPVWGWSAPTVWAGRTLERPAGPGAAAWFALRELTQPVCEQLRSGRFSILIPPPCSNPPNCAAYRESFPSRLPHPGKRWNAPGSTSPATTTTLSAIGVALGTGGGGQAFVEEQYRLFHTQGKGSLFSITAGTHGNLSSELSIALGLRGPSHVLSTGCTSSTDALGYASLLIRAGIIPMMLAGGADAIISHGILTAFEKLRVVSTRQWDDPRQSSRPFSADRDGFVLGEGAWMFVLEDADHAARRGAPALAELAGYASTCDAYHRVQIAPDVLEPVRAIELALADASLSTTDIDYVNLHGTSTELNDRMETAAIKKCFGPLARSIPMSSTKSMIGHPQGAAAQPGLRRRFSACTADTYTPRSISKITTPPAIWITFRTKRGRRRSGPPCATASRLEARTARSSSSERDESLADPGRCAVGTQLQ